MAHAWWHWGDDEWDDFDYSYDDDAFDEDYDWEKSYEKETSFLHYEPPSDPYSLGSGWTPEEYESYDPQVKTYSSPEGIFGSGDVFGIGEEGEFGGTSTDLPRGSLEAISKTLDDIPPEEEQSYPELARNFINQLAPWIGGAAKIKKFADGMTAQRQRQGGGGGGGRQVQAPYTTHKAGTPGRTQANIQSSFQGRDSRQLMALLSQQSRQAASGVQIVANKAADVGDPIKGNDLYDLISGETKPLGAKQQLPTGQSFRSLSIRRTQRA